MRKLLVILLAQAAFGQEPIVVERVAGEGDAARLLRVDATDAPAMEILARASAVLSVPLKADPAVLDLLVRKTVTVRRDKVALDELGLLIALKLGVSAALEDGVLLLGPGGAAGTLAASQGLVCVEHAMLAHAEPQLMAGLRYQRACLLLESGASAEAASAFGDLVNDFPAHPLAAGARVFAVAASLSAGRHAAAMSIITAIEESREGLPAVSAAALLPARVHAAAGNLKEALLRARKVAASGRFLRDRVLAGLLCAEINYRRGEGQLMIDAIEKLPSGWDRTCRDLVPKVAFARGLALKMLKDERAGLLHLEVAFRAIDDAAKPAVGHAIADCLVSLGQPVPAWLAIRQAEGLEKDPADLRRTRARRAEVEESMGAFARASETCLAILSGAPGPFPEAERVLATLARCLLATDRIEDARSALEALTDRDVWRGWALFQLALLERRTHNHERALRALARLENRDCKPPGPAAAEVRTVRGRLLLEIGDPLQAADVFRGTKEEAQR